jgi:hypothetical protein
LVAVLLLGAQGSSLCLLSVLGVFGGVCLSMERRHHRDTEDTEIYKGFPVPAELNDVDVRIERLESEHLWQQKL